MIPHLADLHVLLQQLLVVEHPLDEGVVLDVVHVLLLEQLLELLQVGRALLGDPGENLLLLGLDVALLLPHNVQLGKVVQLHQELIVDQPDVLI